MNLLPLVVKDRKRIVLENIALRHQLDVSRRSVKRPNVKDGNRIFLLTLMRILKEWQQAPVLVQPETLVKWHGKGFKHYWRRKSRSKRGRPPISMKLIHLIRRMSVDDVLWGAPRIMNKLALWGHTVAESTVAKYMVRHRPADSNQSRNTFLHNHLAEIALATSAC